MTCCHFIHLFIYIYIFFYTLCYLIQLVNFKTTHVNCLYVIVMYVYLRLLQQSSSWTQYQHIFKWWTSPSNKSIDITRRNQCLLGYFLELLETVNTVTRNLTTLTARFYCTKIAIPHNKLSVPLHSCTFILTIFLSYQISGLHFLL